MQAGGGVVNSDGSNIGSVILGGGVLPAVLGPPSADTIIGGAGAITVNASYANDFVFAGPGALQFTGGLGASTILGNAAGTASITGGAGSVIAVAYGTTNFTGGSGAATVAAFGGGVTINGGTGTGLFLGSPDGNSRISAGTGRATMFGGGDGDVLTAGSAGLGILVAGRGAETLVGGAGADLFAVVRGTASNAVVQNFTKGQDFITFTGFSAPEVASALSSAGLVGGSQQLTLADGTKILFAGITGLSAGNIL